MGSLLPSGDKSEGPLQDASFRHSRRHHSAAALGSATADERVKKEAKMKTISSPSGGYNSTTDKMLRFVMIKTSADMASSCAMSRTDSYFYLTLDGKNHERCKTKHFTHPPGDFSLGALDTFDGDVLGDCISTKFPSGLFEYEIHTNLHEGFCPEYVILLFTDGTQLECEVKTDLYYVESFRCIG